MVGEVLGKLGRSDDAGTVIWKDEKAQPVTNKGARYFTSTSKLKIYPRNLRLFSMGYESQPGAR